MRSNWSVIAVCYVDTVFCSTFNFCEILNSSNLSFIVLFTLLMACFIHIITYTALHLSYYSFLSDMTWCPKTLFFSDYWWCIFHISEYYNGSLKAFLSLYKSTKILHVHVICYSNHGFGYVKLPQYNEIFAFNFKILLTV